MTNLLPGLPGGPDYTRKPAQEPHGEAFIPRAHLDTIAAAYEHTFMHGVAVGIGFQTDPHLETGQRGILLPPDVQEDVLRRSMSGTNRIDPQLIRYGLAFWDKLLVVATPNVGMGQLPAMEMGKTLNEEGTVLIANAHMDLAVTGAVVGPAYLAAIAELDERQLGRWTLGRTIDGWAMSGGPVAVETPSVGMWLQNAVAVPHLDTPIHEILEFRHRRLPEVLRLWDELEATQARISEAEDPRLVATLEMKRLDEALADHLAVSLERKFPLRLANVKMKISMKTWAGAAAGFEGAIHKGLPASAAVLAGAAGAALASFESEIVKRDVSYRSSAFEYVAEFQRQIA